MDLGRVSVMLVHPKEYSPLKPGALRIPLASKIMSPGLSNSNTLEILSQ